MKSRNYKGRELLPLAVSDAAQAGDADAVEQVLRYYEGYINKRGTIMRDDSETHMWKRESTFTTEAQAEAYIKHRLNITGAEAETAALYSRAGLNIEGAER